MNFELYVIVKKYDKKFYMDHCGNSVFWSDNISDADIFAFKADADNVAKHVDGIVKTINCEFEK